MFLRFKTSIFVISLSLATGVFALGQAVPAKTDETKPQPAATPVSKGVSKTVTAEDVAESAILVYAFPGGRVTLNQIRKTAIERGKTSVQNAEGRMTQASYQKFTTRGETIGKEKIRLDQEFPGTRYSLVYNEDKIFGIANDTVFDPLEGASRSFQNQIVYGLETLLRYKENESKLELGGREKIMGVDLYVLDVTDKQNRKTRFYISAKSFYVKILEYEDAGVKYKRKFYNYNYAQGTLVPYRSVLWAGDKMVEETEIGTVTYGQKVDDGMFAAS